MKAEDILMVLAFGALAFAGYKFAQSSGYVGGGSSASTAPTGLVGSSGVTDATLMGVTDQSVYTGMVPSQSVDPFAIPADIAAATQKIAAQMGFNQQTYTAFHL